MRSNWWSLTPRWAKRGAECVGFRHDNESECEIPRRIEGRKSWPYRDRSFYHLACSAWYVRAGRKSTSELISAHLHLETDAASAVTTLKAVNRLILRWAPIISLLLLLTFVLHDIAYANRTGPSDVPQFASTQAFDASPVGDHQHSKHDEDLTDRRRTSARGNIDHDNETTPYQISHNLLSAESHFDRSVPIVSHVDAPTGLGDTSRRLALLQIYRI